mgnify:CR=1 FL=1
MKEFVSKDFFMSLLKIDSNYESNPFFTFTASSLRVTTAFLLNDDLKFYTSLTISGTIDFITLEDSKFE